MAVTREGRLWAFGSNAHSQLGLGEQPSRNAFVTRPALVPMDSRVVDVTCGFSHTLVLTGLTPIIVKIGALC